MVNTIRILSKPGGHIYLYECFGVKLLLTTKANLSGRFPLLTSST